MTKPYEKFHLCGDVQLDSGLVQNNKKGLFQFNYKGYMGQELSNGSSLSCRFSAIKFTCNFLLFYSFENSLTPWRFHKIHIYFDIDY